ncbi:DNA repair and recombination protein RAD54B-like [Penaeus japonicus]|uniref:DNA repair and recombination protein RAD54B-like n=1 Tax=Penaeus japonicus TaxID=27405 RepID=UPI001C70B40C|nr:DNA repair and recombination protein RAD54B-like [Penaeus japonicus]XP_042891288.1 DNA repair and recombination protein RAD54B-like [Penaeus japonicus]
MRRSAAPSQLLKRAQFRPPFASQPPAKRPCLERPDSVQEEGSKSRELETPPPSASKGPLRTTADILSLLKKPQNTQTNSQNGTSSNLESGTTVAKYPLSETNRYRTSGLSSSFKSVGHKPGLASKGGSVAQGSTENQQPQETRYFSVVWCKLSRKKHKNWEGDAILIVRGRSVTLKDTEGKEIGRASGYKLTDLASLEEGNTLPIGGKEIEIQGVISAESYATGQCFMAGASQVATVPASPAVAPRPKPKPFRLPTLGRGPSRAGGPQMECTSLYDPTNPNALVMPRPPSQHQWTHNSVGAPVVDVVVDPYISGKLRPHQQNGVIFLYECVMGYRLNDNHGAILADEMGLGKTLQCITLIWTLLKQGPYGGIPVVRRALIVTPSSLTNNWGKEFKKWLGKERIQPYIVDQNHKAEDFVKQQHSAVMIISYEMFMRCASVIDSYNFDIMLCDEGHRLKNANIKTTSLLCGLSTRKRIILTGTPIQNDLQELYALVDFVNPGVLGTSASFRRIYEEPIIAYQQPTATESEKELGETRAAQLNRTTSLFILRRTQEIINRYLPPKVEYVVFCQPSDTQLMLYDEIVGCRTLRQCLNSNDVGDHLSAIMALRKLCNHPALLAQDNEQQSHKEMAKELASLLPEHIEYNRFDEADSGKLAVVSCMLWSLSEAGNEKIVLVSNYTSTLDMLANLCERYNYQYLRLDGSTPAGKRQELVDKFNNKYSKDFVFLLSAKAGGVGLNLIGASRILLYDIDWNPATDLQAMARVWRDGQQRKVYIYRLLMTGSLDEKMYQRQVRKQGLSGAVVDARDSERVHFSTKELKDLFTLHSNTPCLTHDMLQCSCDQTGQTIASPGTEENTEPERSCQLGDQGRSKSSSNTTMDQLQKWCHSAAPFSPEIIRDPCLEAASDFITFLFHSVSDTSVKAIPALTEVRE